MSPEGAVKDDVGSQSPLKQFGFFLKKSIENFRSGSPVKDLTQEFEVPEHAIQQPQASAPSDELTVVNFGKKFFDEDDEYPVVFQEKILPSTPSFELFEHKLRVTPPNQQKQLVARSPSPLEQESPAQQNPLTDRSSYSTIK